MGDGSDDGERKRPYRRLRRVVMVPRVLRPGLQAINDGGRDAPLTPKGERMWRIADVVLGVMIVAIVLTR